VPNRLRDPLRRRRRGANHYQSGQQLRYEKRSVDTSAARVTLSYDSWRLEMGRSAGGHARRRFRIDMLRGPERRRPMSGRGGGGFNQGAGSSPKISTLFTRSVARIAGSVPKLQHRKASRSPDEIPRKHFRRTGKRKAWSAKPIAHDLASRGWASPCASLPAPPARSARFGRPYRGWSAGAPR
jgi:hypothetical protein